MKTKRTNHLEKRAHWKSARAERRGRFAHGDFETVDEDMAYRTGDRTIPRGGRAMVNFSGHHTRVLWNTADKSHIKWRIENGTLAPRVVDELRKTLHLRF